MIDVDFEKEIVNNMFNRARWFNKRKAEVRVVWEMGKMVPNVMVAKVRQVEDNGTDSYVSFEILKTFQEPNPLEFKLNAIRINVKDILKITDSF